MKPLLGRSILVADCDGAALAQRRERLLELGARVICSSTVDSALANAIAFPPGTFDAAVMEHRPPRLNAAELAETMRALPSMKQLPLIVIAGADDDLASARAGSRFGAVLARPVSVERLRDQLSSMLSPASAMQLGASVARGEYRGTVLMAEDDPVNAETLRAMLLALGFTVVLAENGKQAVARAATSSFDLLLMDGQMPLMDGLEATRIIRREEAGRGVRRPIVGVTANGLPEYRDTCLQAGMDDVAHKPLAMTALLRILTRWLPESNDRGVQLAQRSDAAASAPQAKAGSCMAQAGIESEPIDWSQVESLREVDPEGTTGLVGRAIGLYIDHGPKLIEEIRGFRSAVDLKDVRRAAHSLKSSSASLGANTVAGLSKTIELAAAGGDCAVIGSTLASLEAEYRRAANALAQGGRLTRGRSD